MKLIIEVAHRVRGRLTVMAMGAVISAIVTLAIPSVLTSTVDAALKGQGFSSILSALIGLTVAGVGCEVLVHLIGVSAIATATAKTQEQLIRHMLALGTSSPFASGDAVTRVVQSCGQVAELPTRLISSGVAIMSAVGAVIALALVDPLLVVTFIIVVPVTVLLARRFVTDVSQARATYWSAQARIASGLLAALSGARTIRVSRTVDREADRVLRPLPELSSAGYSLWELQRNVVWRLALLVPLAELLVLGVAGLSLTYGRISPGQLLAAVVYTAIALAGLNEIDAAFELAEARAAARRIEDVLELPVPTPGTGHSSGPGAVTFRGVHAGVLRGVDLDVSAGACVAVVGPSGSGKSLLVGLLGGIARADRGEVLVDGVPVELLGPGWLSYAPERPALIGTTVRDCVTYGAEGLGRDRVATAVRIAHAEDFIDRLPLRLDTPLAQAPLSGGEFQRLGLARALVRDATVYVLDDATSGLDARTEELVGQTVTSELSGRTRIILTHRASTAARCDLVIWLEDGVVRSIAPHELLWSDSDYRAMLDHAEVV
jgi:ATP-binding cassette subfamily B protein